MACVPTTGIVQRIAALLALGAELDNLYALTAKDSFTVSDLGLAKPPA